MLFACQSPTTEMQAAADHHSVLIKPKWLFVETHLHYLQQQTDNKENFENILKLLLVIKPFQQTEKKDGKPSKSVRSLFCYGLWIALVHCYLYCYANVQLVRELVFALIPVEFPFMKPDTKQEGKFIPTAEKACSLNINIEFSWQLLCVQSLGICLTVMSLLEVRLQQILREYPSYLHITYTWLMSLTITVSVQ